jgi:cephalosporin hydroxylase
MTDYQFTKDWFGWAPPVWEQLVPHLPHNVERSFLEIGSFEGRSMVWIVENMMNPGDELICVDTWEGGEEHGAEDMGTVEERFHHNCAVARSKNGACVVPYKGTSVDYLGLALSEGEYKITFDFIYIDGSHIAKDVLTDACMAWPLLKKGGIMVFDDYMWGNPRDILHRPKPAIDAFTNIFAEEVDIIHVGYQLVVRKK